MIPYAPILRLLSKPLPATALLMLLCAATWLQARPQASYTVAPNFTTETFEVTAELNEIPGDTLVFHLPIWGPGAYDIVNFGAFVSRLTAVGRNGQALRVFRGDTNTFRIVGAGGYARIAYTVHDIESVPSSLWFGLSDIEKDFVFANTVAIFGYADGYKNIPCAVTFAVPKGWDVSIGLDPAKPARAGVHAYVAADYDDLVDAPLVMGRFQRLEFTVKGVPHSIALFAPEKAKPAQARRLVDSVRRIVEIVSGFFGDMPYKRYDFQLFLVRPTPEDVLFGALEHRNSSTYRMPWSEELAESSLLGVIAHEYWHAWSPKRIHVAELGPFDYQRAPRTNSLWFAEGLTEYYAKVLLVRNGMVGADEVTDLARSGLGRNIGKPQRQPITELSLHVAELPPEQVMPLYTKGPLLGLMLDAEIRLQTGNKRSLDDAMRAFNEEFGKTGRTFGDDDIIPFMERATGAHLADFYNKYIAGRESLPIADYLGKIGFAVSTRYRDQMTLGASVESVPNGWSVLEVTPNGSAAKMGLMPGDVLMDVEMERARLPLSQAPSGLASSLGDIRGVKGVRVLRGGDTLNVAAVFVPEKVPNSSVAIDANPGELARMIRKSMLGL